LQNLTTMPNPNLTKALDDAHQKYTQNPAHEEEFLAALYAYTEEMLGVEKEENENGVMVIKWGNEDAVQEAVMKTWRLLPRFDVTKAKFSTWVYTIVKSAENDLGDKERRKLPPDLLSLEALKNVPSNNISAETRYAIQEAVSKLPQKERSIVDRIYQGDTVEEAAKELGISRATAFRHWSSAQEKLREMA
jgi:RNA polymerase sigma factor (sigma-70 family)